MGGYYPQCAIVGASFCSATPDMDRHPIEGMEGEGFLLWAHKENIWVSNI